MNQVYRQLIIELPEVAKKLYPYAYFVEETYTKFDRIVNSYTIDGKRTNIRHQHLQDNATEFLNSWERIIEL